MLILSRKLDEKIVIGEAITVTVLEIRTRNGYPRVRLGIEAPQDVPIDRPEIREAKRRDGTLRGGEGDHEGDRGDAR